MYLLAKHDFGRRAGILAAIVFGTSLETIVLARAAVTDMTLVCTLAAALYGYRRWLDSKSAGWAIFCGAMTGLGMLAKGPVVVLLAATIIIHLLWTRQLRRLASWQALLAVVAALAVGLPWYLAMWQMHGQPFIEALKA